MHWSALVIRANRVLGVLTTIRDGATNRLRIYNNLQPNPVRTTAAIVAIYCVLGVLLTSYEAVTGATRGFGAWFGVMAILISANCGVLFGLLGVVLYILFMDALFLGQPFVADVKLSWLLGAPLPVAIGVLVAPVIVRAWMRPGACRNVPATAARSELLKLGASDAQEVVKLVQQGCPEQLAWHVQRGCKANWSAYDVGFFHEVAAHIEGSPVPTHQEWLSRTVPGGDLNTEDARLASKVDQA